MPSPVDLMSFCLSCRCCWDHASKSQTWTSRQGHDLQAKYFYDFIFYLTLCFQSVFSVDAPHPRSHQCIPNKLFSPPPYKQLHFYFLTDSQQRDASLFLLLNTALFIIYHFACWTQSDVICISCLTPVSILTMNNSEIHIWSLSKMVHPFWA